MERKAKKYLFDILSASDNIFDVHLAKNIEKNAFSDNITIQRAVERELEIIGEAAHKLIKIGYRFEGQDQVINRRNTLIHQYDVTSPAQVWNYIVTELPVLRETVSNLLKKGY